MPPRKRAAKPRSTISSTSRNAKRPVKTVHPLRPKGCEVLPFVKVEGVCDRCGKELTGKRRRWCSIACKNMNVKQHRWTTARAAARRRDKYKCTKCGAGREARLEVNHIVPRCGAGYGWGCWNHLSNLETVCHDCHVGITAQQRRDRKSA